jgi:hypothetical protein
VDGIAFLLPFSANLLSVYRKPDFSMLVFYPATLLNSSVTSNSLLVESLFFYA